MCDLTALSRPPSEICLFHCPPKLRSDLVGDVSHELAFERMHAHLSVSIMREAYGVELPHHQAVCARWAQCCEDIAYQCCTKPGSEPSDADMKEAAALLDACVNGEASPRVVDLSRSSLAARPTACDIRPARVIFDQNRVIFGRPV